MNKSKFIFALNYLFITATLFIISTSTLAYNFLPTSVEFASWPFECKKIYPTTQIGQANGFHRNMSKKEIVKWRDIGTKNGGLWHYCEGLIKIRRAEISLDPKIKEWNYKVAIKDLMYGYRIIPKSNPWSASMGIALARVYRGQGNFSQAASILDSVLKFHPVKKNAYVLYAMLYFDKKDFSQAKNYLLKAKIHGGNISPEVVYHLGLIELKLNNIESAKKYAAQAKSMGFPLKGLDKKIKKYIKGLKNSNKK